MKRARKRGFSHVSMTLEAAAVMVWFVVLVLGEKYVGDATTARRRAEDSVQQSSIANAMSYCSGGAASAASSSAGGVPSSLQVRPQGNLNVSQIFAILALFGIGHERTYPVYTEPLRGTFANASSGGVTPHQLVGEGTHTFTGNRALACLERSKDSPIPSINQYRGSIFDTTIRGYGPNP
ncbi:hypothetical protein LVJ94_07775 [Pendulispora rubella]|uniref:Flp pilus-assembly TadG-like N-terminal domain-containing protein n=1 Tax=Pendulispora rubella TaxID=2741070 RepID=A0ABZ2L869_9BACT